MNWHSDFIASQNTSNFLPNQTTNVQLTHANISPYNHSNLNELNFNNRIMTSPAYYSVGSTTSNPVLDQQQQHHQTLYDMSSSHIKMTNNYSGQISDGYGKNFSSKSIQANSSTATPNTAPNLVTQVVDLIRRLNIRLVAFDFDYTIVSIHTGGQWLDSAEKLAEFVRPYFRKLIPALLKCPDLFVCVVTYSPQEELIREVLRISLEDEQIQNNLVDRIVIKGNTKEFLELHGIESCYTNGKQIHLKYCRSYFETLTNLSAKTNSSPTKQNMNNSNINSNNKANKENFINDANILLIDDDPQNIKFAEENDHLAFQIENNTKLIDLYNYLNSKLPYAV